VSLSYRHYKSSGQEIAAPSKGYWVRKDDMWSCEACESFLLTFLPKKVRLVLGRRPNLLFAEESPCRNMRSFFNAKDDV